jgi:hypothetical protein
MKILYIVFALLIGIQVSFAQEEFDVPANSCRNGYFPQYGKYGIGIVKTPRGARTYIYNDDEGCPEGKSCRSKEYLINGDEVITSRNYKGFTCVWYQPDRGHETVGWVRTTSLELPLYLTGLYDYWDGEWEYAGNSLKVSKTSKTDTFDVSGNAFWKGIGDNIHIGEVNATGTVQEGAIMTLKEYPCEVTLKLLIGKYLIARDNLDCGGANVTFNGVYMKKAPKAAKPKRP